MLATLAACGQGSESDGNGPVVDTTRRNLPVSPFERERLRLGSVTPGDTLPAGYAMSLVLNQGCAQEVMQDHAFDQSLTLRYAGLEPQTQTSANKTRPLAVSAELKKPLTAAQLQDLLAAKPCVVGAAPLTEFDVQDEGETSELVREMLLDVGNRSHLKWFAKQAKGERPLVAVLDSRLDSRTNRSPMTIRLSKALILSAAATCHRM